MWTIIALITAPIAVALLSVYIKVYKTRLRQGEVTPEEQARMVNAYIRVGWTLIFLITGALIAAAIWWEWRSQVTF